MSKHEAHSGRQKQQGAVLILFGLSLVVLIGFAGLVIDLGRFFVIKTELQNAVDACALSAASQLRPGQNNSTSLVKAVAYGRVFSTGGAANVSAIKNKADFQSKVVDIGEDQISFSETLNGDYKTIAASANPNTAKFAKCSYALEGLPILFMRVLNSGLGTQKVSAMAVATFSPSVLSCAIPVGVCKKPGGTLANDFLFAEGEWISVKDNKYGTGNFGWIDFSPPGGGASELAELLTGSGQCQLDNDIHVGEQGNKAGLDLAWNSRFGWYKNGAGNPQVGSAPPDFSGYAYSIDKNWPSGANAYSGTSSVSGAVNFETARNNHLPYQLDTPSGISKSSYNTPTSSTQLALNGQNRRLAVAPVVDCTVWNTNPSGQPKVEGWACVLMLNPIDLSGKPKGAEVWDIPKLEFLGLSTKVGSPCSSGGLAGAGGSFVPVLVQ